MTDDEKKMTNEELETQAEIELEKAFLESESHCDFSRLSPWEHTLIAGNRRNAFYLGYNWARRDIQTLVQLVSLYEDGLKEALQLAGDAEGDYMREISKTPMTAGTLASLTLTLQEALALGEKLKLKRGEK